MTRRLIGAAVAALTTGALLAGPAVAANADPAPTAPLPARPAPTAPLAATDYHAIVALSNCSGSVVRGPLSTDNDPALVLTNGHCSELGMPGPGVVVTNRTSSRSFSLLNSSGTGTLGTLRASQIEYSTMTDTDVTLYKLRSTYAQLRSQYGVNALNLSTTHPTAGSAISVVSGYWRTTYNCNIDAFAYRLREASWTWKDSIRYTAPCNTIGGTSGSPVIDNASGKVVGVNNTSNENGETCTLDNPCEVDQNGTTTIHPGIGYGQETYLLAQCLTATNDIDLTQASCQLPRP
ncbi:trypsin-like peptidase domain-containing protein [Actinomadura oligospora]|uniref:trypsin-like peptidase domain-containing protein n=1 Tax=Actinomadura oligospora TaxID=111804 RepID=UPI00047C2A56|nr:trypsin-like peptidase domain-containing protein [Actinomadura oligospora]